MKDFSAPPVTTAGTTSRPAPGDGISWNTLYDRLSLLALLVLALLVVLTFDDYAISNDEGLHLEYGKRLLAFYTSGFTDRSAFAFKDLYLYGGLFDVAATLAAPLLPLDPYETRHLLGGLVGVLGIAGAWRLARLLAGSRAGFLALALFGLSASYYGAIFNNPKDIPFAAAMAWFLYYTCRIVPQLPRPRLRHVVMLGVTGGASLGVKVIGGLGVVYVLAALMLHAFAEARRGSGRAALASAGGALVSLLPAAAIAYAVMAASWPWSVLSPLNPLLAVSVFSNFVFDIDTILAGEKVKMSKVPPYYLLVYFGVKLRESTLVGLALAALAAGVHLAAWARGRVSLDPARAIQYGLVALAIAFPLLLYVILRPTDFNGIRHYFFLLPPVMVLAGAGIERAWSVLEAWRPAVNAIVVPALTAVGVLQAATMVELHPHQYVYYNALVGGLEGAENRYEMDYWSNVAREATLELNHFIELEFDDRPIDRTFNVAFCNDRAAAQAYMAPYLRFVREWRTADFFVATTHMWCDDQLDGKVIIEVERMGVALGVVKDRREVLARQRVRRPLAP